MTEPGTKAMLKSIALAAAIALIGGSAAVAQNHPTGADHVEAQFREDEEYGLDGPGIDRARGALAARMSVNHTFNLRAGRTYSVYARCDENCFDMYIVIFGPDPDLAMLGTSVGDHARDAVSFTATRSGEHTAMVQMMECGSASCNYGVRLYEHTMP